MQSPPSGKLCKVHHIVYCCTFTNHTICPSIMSSPTLMGGCWSLSIQIQIKHANSAQKSPRDPKPPCCEEAVLTTDHCLPSSSMWFKKKKNFNPPPAQSWLKSQRMCLRSMNCQHRPLAPVPPEAGLPLRAHRRGEAKVGGEQMHDCHTVQVKLSCSCSLVEMFPYFSRRHSTDVQIVAYVSHFQGIFSLQNTRQVS